MTIRQSAKEILQSGAMENWKRALRCRTEPGTPQWRLSCLRGSLRKLCDAVESGNAEGIRIAVLNSRESLRIVEASLGLNHSGELRIPKETK